MTSDKGEDSVTDLVAMIRCGQSEAAQQLCDRYFPRMLALAERIAGPRADYEAAANSAFRRFLASALDGDRVELLDRTVVWVWLANLTRKRAIDARRREVALKRGGGRIQCQADNDAELAWTVNSIPSSDATPLERLLDAELVARLWSALSDENLRSVARGKLENLTNAELAHRLGCSLATIERRLRLIRRIWDRELVDD
jgi:RNA polymerase sigma factor (sigma-70 family)